MVLDRCTRVEALGGVAVGVGLGAPFVERVARNHHSDQPASKRRQAAALSGEVLATLDGRWRMKAEDELPFGRPDLRIDTSRTGPNEAARQVVVAFSVPANGRQQSS